MRLPLSLLFACSVLACDSGSEGPADLGFFTSDASSPPMDAGFQPNMSIQVQRVLDGDTVVLVAGASVMTPDNRPVSGEKVRMLGVDAPEIAHDPNPADCWGDESHQAARDLMQGRTIQLIYDPAHELRDQYGRLLAYIGLQDGSIANKTMIRQGHAKSFRAFNHERLGEFNQAEAEAEAEGLGGWSACGW